ncbi:MAG: hypothetical protein ABI304_11665 [Rudaea sp.]
MQTASLAIFVFLGAFALHAQADQNLLPNGDFNVSNKLSGWTNTTDQEFDPTRDADGKSDSGSLQPPVLFTNYQGPTSTCFSVLPGASYTYGGQATEALPQTFSFVVVTNMVCSVYPNTSCSEPGMPLDGVNLSVGTLNPYGFAQSQSISGTLASNATSANCAVTALAHGEFTQPPGPINVDNLFFKSVAPAASVTVDGYMSGSWYDPAQSGHGFAIDITDQENQIIAYWFNYAPDGSGRQVWLYAQGTYDPTKNSVTLDAGITSGARFPPMFSPGDVKVTPWGTITFTFTDCNHGTASWQSSVPGYGSDSIPISRLTHIKGTACGG